jgi:hypothetical protein
VQGHVQDTKSGTIATEFRAAMQLRQAIPLTGKRKAALCSIDRTRQHFVSHVKVTGSFAFNQSSRISSDRKCNRTDGNHTDFGTASELCFFSFSKHDSGDPGSRAN